MRKNDFCSLGQHLSGIDSKLRLGLGTPIEHANAATQGSLRVLKSLDIAVGLISRYFTVGEFN